MEVKIKKEDAQKILDYLVTRPFAEVHNLAPILTGAQVLDQPKVEEPKVEK